MAPGLLREVTMDQHIGALVGGPWSSGRPGSAVLFRMLAIQPKRKVNSDLAPPQSSLAPFANIASLPKESVACP